MKDLGHEVFHYGAEGSEVDATEHVTVITAEEQARWFGHVDWRREGFKLDWTPEAPYWQVANLRAAAGIIARKQKKDFVCLIGGLCQKPIADLVGEADTMTVEFGVGYYGVFAKYRVFESYTHQAGVYGRDQDRADGRLYDAVIPNYYDPEDFPPKFDNDSRYLLFLARLIKRKGLNTALAVAKAASVPLVIAGQGVVKQTATGITTEDGIEISLNDMVEYVGHANVEKRAKLMRNALALIQPTEFMEPFGGNVVEAQLCGTPVITTDHAAFSETVKHGVTGFRCHTLAQFVAAVGAVSSLDRERIHEIAVVNYSIRRVGKMYQEYFELLSDLWNQGWNTERSVDLSWLNKV